MTQQPSTTAEALNVAVIIGSVREGRFGPTVARWFVGQAAQRDDLVLDVVDLVDYPLPLEKATPGDPPDAATAELRDGLARRLDRADAFVVVTPEYNNTLPAALKNAIDWIFDEWAAKPVGFVSYGGMSGGLWAVSHLRHVFTELHAVPLREQLIFHQVWNRFEGGVPRDAEESEVAAKTLLNRLVWWGEALRTARAARPYQR
ncbi:NAD(P)H-dependent oxidoreductase [Streptomyces sp. N50]|uniref:NADPH-dependent FMN reductase n=1 Tax=Streptomyces sp. N50 TaxID=3081765 RepID=UPI00296200A8|nr:NAD(P)H-dependent oxidoreductase [Streptomyces sp. N50]WOX15244.1 NAD(P)H-dependent oxidoreductase [Streptomyces sp. N50]